MKRMALWMFVTMLINLSGYAEFKLDPQYRKAVESGASTRINVHVVDDEGVPVSDVDVKAVFAFKDGERSGSYASGSNGVAVVEGITTGHYVELNLSKEGYYESKVKYRYLRLAENRQVKDGKWQPWGKDEQIVLRKIKNQKRMIRCSDVFSMPTTNKWLGFDFELKDWTAPYGKGKEADIEVQLMWDGKPPTESRFVRLDVRFPGNAAGCYCADKVLESKFTGVYNAMTNDCYGIRELSFYSDVRDGRHDVEEFDYSKVYILRTRCKLNDVGDVVSANYSTIRAVLVNGGWEGRGEMTLRYYYNSTPSDTNLEPKR